jgi:hypothetical protein
MYKFSNISELIPYNNKNGYIVINKSDGNKHCVSEWKENFDRITIAFDIVPSEFIDLGKITNMIQFISV